MKNLTKFALTGLFASTVSLVACRPAADRQQARLSGAQSAGVAAANDIDSVPPEAVATQAGSAPAQGSPARRP